MAITMRDLMEGEKIKLNGLELEGEEIVLIKGKSSSDKPIFYTKRAYLLGSTESHDLNSGIGKTKYDTMITNFGDLIIDKLINSFGFMCAQGGIATKRAYKAPSGSGSVSRDFPANNKYPFIYFANEEFLKESGLLTPERIKEIKPTGTTDVLPVYDSSGTTWASGYNMGTGEPVYYMNTQEDVRRVFAVSFGTEFSKIELNKTSENGTYTLNEPSNGTPLMYVKINNKWRKVKVVK